MTEDLAVDEIVDDSYRPGVKVVTASASVEDSNYFEEAENYLFSTRSRLARNFREAGIAPGGGYAYVDSAMRNEHEYPGLRVDEDEISAILFVRDGYEAFGFEDPNPFQIEVGDEIGRLGAYNPEDIGIDPRAFSQDFAGEKEKAHEIANIGEKLSYDEIKHPAVQPEVQDLSEKEGVSISRDMGLVKLSDRLLEPNHELSKEEIMNSDLDKLVEEVGKMPENLGPGLYLGITESPVTIDGCYTVLEDPMTNPAIHINSRVGDPEWQNPMVVEFIYPPVTGAGIPDSLHTELAGEDTEDRADHFTYSHLSDQIEGLPEDFDLRLRVDEMADTSEIYEPSFQLQTKFIRKTD